MESMWNSNLWIIYKCSTNYLILSTCAAVLAILFVYLWNDSRIFSKYKSKLTAERRRRELCREGGSETDRTQLNNSSDDNTEENVAKLPEPSLMSRIKTARQQYIVDQLTANMTEEQLKEEKEVERAQLEAIFKLLQEQQEKFQVASVDQLHDQLNLYR